MSQDKLETLKVSYYLPILDEIKKDLTFLYERDYDDKFYGKTNDSRLYEFRLSHLVNSEHLMNSCTSARTEQGCGSQYQRCIDEEVPCDSSKEIKKKDIEIEFLNAKVISFEENVKGLKEQNEALLKDNTEKQRVISEKIIEERDMLDKSFNKNEDLRNMKKDIEKKDLLIKDYLTLINDLNSQIESWELNVQYLKESNEDIQKDIVERERLINEKMDIIVEKDKLINRLKENKESDQLMKESEEIIDEKNKNIQDLKKEVAELDTNLKWMKSEHDKMIKLKDDEISKKTTQYDHVVDEKDILQKELSEKNKVTHKLTEQYESCKSDLDSIKNEFEIKKQLIEVLQNQIDELNERKEYQSSQNEYILDLEEKLKQFESKENTLDEDLKTLSDNNKKRKQELKIKNNEIKDLKESIEELENTISEIKRESRSLGKRLERKTKECNEAEENSSNFEKLNRELKRKLKDAEKKIDDTEDKDIYLKEIQDLKSITIERKKQIDDFQLEMNEIKRQKDMADRKVKERDTDITNLNKEMAELRKKLDIAKKDVTDKEKSIKDKQVALENMKQKLKCVPTSDTNDNSKILQRVIDSKDAEMEQMEQKIENYKHSLELKYEENDVLKKEMEKWKTELENLKKLRFNESMGASSSGSGGMGDTFSPQPSRTVYQKPITPVANQGNMNEFYPKPNSPPANQGNKPQYPEWWKKHMNL